MNSGWIKLYRKLLSNDLWIAEPFTRGQAWIDLLLLANHKQGFIIIRGNKVVVKRGQVGWSEVKLSRRWKWSRNKVRRFLVLLKKEGQIEQQKSSVTSLITLTNFDPYQGERTAGETAEGQQKVQQTIPEQENKEINKKNIPKKDSSQEFNLDSLRPEWFHENDWKAIVLHRRKKKAAETKRAYIGLIKEIQVAIEKGHSLTSIVDTICQRDWTGFKADWLGEADGKVSSLIKGDCSLCKYPNSVLCSLPTEPRPCINFTELESET